MTNRVECPRCGGAWYQDLEAESNLPYTCFTCGNGARTFTQADLDAAKEANDRWHAAWDAHRELSEGQRMAMAELGGYED